MHFCYALCNFFCSPFFPPFFCHPAFFCHPERSEGSITADYRSLATLGMTKKKRDDKKRRTKKRRTKNEGKKRRTNYGKAGEKCKQNISPINLSTLFAVMQETRPLITVDFTFAFTFEVSIPADCNLCIRRIFYQLLELENGFHQKSLCLSIMKTFHTLFFPRSDILAWLCCSCTSSLSMHWRVWPRKFSCAQIIKRS